VTPNWCIQKIEGNAFIDFAIFTVCEKGILVEMGYSKDITYLVVLLLAK